MQLFVVDSIASPSAPTVAEITAGSEVTGELISLATPLDGDAVASNDMSSAFNKSIEGTYGGGATAVFYRDAAAETAYGLLPRSTETHLVLARFGFTGGTPTIADTCEVWPVRVITRSPADLVSNTPQQFTVNLATTDEPTLAATVA
jgi:hypothetical protein